MIGFQLHEYDLQRLKLRKTRLQSPIKYKEQSNKGVASKASPKSTTLNIPIYKYRWARLIQVVLGWKWVIVLKVLQIPRIRVVVDWCARVTGYNREVGKAIRRILAYLTWIDILGIVG
jgi:hypothetical protein